jgi:hypothetical protein
MEELYLLVITDEVLPDGSDSWSVGKKKAVRTALVRAGMGNPDFEVGVGRESAPSLSLGACRLTQTPTGVGSVHHHVKTCSLSSMCRTCTGMTVPPA